MRRGRLIAIEGGDAGGKQTQSMLLTERLKGHRIAFPRYETLLGQEILANLKGDTEVYINSKCNGWKTVEHAPTANALVRQSLFTFDRYLAAAEIESKLAAGTHVVLDRYWLSGVIFGSSDGLDPVMLEAVHQRLPQPDLWLLLDVSPEESIKRRPERRDMYEKDSKSQWRRAKYLEFFSDRDFCINDHGFRKWYVVDGSQSIDVVFAAICAKVRGHFGRDVLDDMDLIAKGKK